MEFKHYIMTIGYGSRSITEFIDLLNSFGVRFLIDLRSKPYSKYKPEFSRFDFEESLVQHEIKYIFMGDSIGGLPEDRSCYTDDHVDYDKVKEKNFYREGIARLVNAYNDKTPIAIMCSEGKPEMCHRSKLIGESLGEIGIPVKHLDEKGKLRTQEEIIKKATNAQLHLFKEPTEALMSRGKY